MLPSNLNKCASKVIMIYIIPILYITNKEYRYGVEKKFRHSRGEKIWSWHVLADKMTRQMIGPYRAWKLTGYRAARWKWAFAYSTANGDKVYYWLFEILAEYYTLALQKLKYPLTSHYNIKGFYRVLHFPPQFLQKA